MSPYDKLAKVYDTLSLCYSGGGISRAKLSHVKLLQPGERVLYLGAGTAKEGLEAACRGAQVTLCDSSSFMLAAARSGFERKGLGVSTVQGDALTVEFPQTFDTIVLPFFLNVLRPSDVAVALRRCCGLVSSGGRIISVDFRAPVAGGGPWRTFFRALQRAYYLPPLLLFGLLTRNPWHELYDYSAMAKKFALPLSAPERFLTRAWGMPLLETLVWGRN